MMELISKEVVRRIIDSERTREQMLEMVESAVTFESSTESTTGSSTEQTDSSTDSSTDCISREAAISAAKHIFKSNSEMKAFCMMKMLEELPPVKPKERTAHWIHKGEMVYTCSACGGSAVIIKVDDFHKEYYMPYLTEWCPKCGARMKSEKV